MSKNSRIGIGVIGLGGISTNIHIPNLKRISNAKIVAISDIDAERCKKVANKFRIKSWYTDNAKLLERADVDAVLVCVPNHVHAAIAIEATNYGKDIFIEKPIATNLKDAKEIIKSAEKSEVLVMVGHCRRFRPTILKARQLVENGRLGDIFLVRGQSCISGPYRAYLPESNWFITPEKSGGGVIIDQGIHLFDLIRWFGGDVSEVTAYSSKVFDQMVVEENAVGMLKFENNALGSFDLSWASNISTPVERLEIHGTAGSIFVEQDFLEEARGVRLINRAKLHIKNIFGKFVDVLTHKMGDNYLEELKHFVKCVQSRTTPIISGIDGLKALEIVLAAYKSTEMNIAVPIESLGDNNA